MTTDLGKISDKVAAGFVVHGQHVEMERLNVVVESLVVEEEFRQQTEVLAVDLGPVSIHLKHRQVVTSVDLIARRTTHVAFLLATHTYIHT